MRIIGGTTSGDFGGSSNKLAKLLPAKLIIKRLRDLFTSHVLELCHRVTAEDAPAKSRLLLGANHKPLTGNTESAEPYVPQPAILVQWIRIETVS